MAGGPTGPALAGAGEGTTASAGAESPAQPLHTNGNQPAATANGSVRTPPAQLDIGLDAPADRCGAAEAAALHGSERAADGASGEGPGKDPDTLTPGQPSWLRRMSDAVGAPLSSLMSLLSGRIAPLGAGPFSAAAAFGSSAAAPNAAAAALNTATVAAMRRKLVGPNTAINYDTPLHIVRGTGCYLFDYYGNKYLDCVNNVAHVGHCHPQVTAAVAKQMAILNTNARYLHGNLVSHAEALTASMPDPLEVTYAVCSGSEANDLAFRITRAARPGADHVAVIGGAYHGHTRLLIDMSPFKYEGPGGEGRKPWVHVLPCPDPYRGLHMDGKAAAEAAIAEAEAAGGRICAFFAESILSCGGQIMPPKGYLADVHTTMRAHGALCVADEVQCGFGRAGTHFWAFDAQGVVPDIVTLGKSIGNGFPMGAVVTRREHAVAFSNGMEYFATCGGCTAAGAAGLAVMSVVASEGLQARAADTGAYLMGRLRALQERFPFLGNVRGTGLMIGIEVVDGSGAKRHAPSVAHWIREAMVARRVLLATDGPYANVLKVKPPMCFGRAEADHLVQQLAQVLAQGVPEEMAAYDAAWHAQGMPKTVKPWLLKA